MPWSRPIDPDRAAACEPARWGWQEFRCGPHEEARTYDPAFAAVSLHLAHLYAAKGDGRRAAASYREALSQDPALRTPFNSAGRWYFGAGRIAQAEAAHRRILVLDPGDSWAHFGLGQIAWKARDWAAAEMHLCCAVETQETSVDAWRALGSVLEKQRCTDEALQAWERSLRLVLMGRRPLSSCSIDSQDDKALEDVAHGAAHLRAARLLARRGDVREAISGYRMAIAMRKDGVAVRMRLAAFWWRNGEIRAGVAEFVRGLGKLPRAVWRGSVHAWRRTRAWVAKLRRARKRRHAEATLSIWH